MLRLLKPGGKLVLLTSCRGARKTNKASVRASLTIIYSTIRCLIDSFVFSYQFLEEDAVDPSIEAIERNWRTSPLLTKE